MREAEAEKGTRSDWGERGEGSGVQCGYEETGAMPVVAMVEEKEKTLKIGYVYDASC